MNNPKWSNLKENKCPNCGKDWLTMGVARFENKSIFCRCGFTISEKEMTRIINNQINFEIKESLHELPIKEISTRRY